MIKIKKLLALKVSVVKLKRNIFGCHGRQRKFVHVCFSYSFNEQSSFKLSQNKL